MDTIEKDLAVGQLFIDHTLMVADVMIAIELACRKREGVRLLYEDELSLPVTRLPFQWQVTVKSGEKLGVTPDRVFALEFAGRDGQPDRAYFFLEADRGTMPVKRQTLLQTSFFRKLLAYEATWVQDIHQRKLGIDRFRVLTVTKSPKRVQSIIAACRELQRGHGLFLFADTGILSADPLASIWQTTVPGRMGELIS
ncbi:MAG TPA: replication-relaxation family protein [Verrucomicrobiae bacterium]|nr:replication-relaxation family protein [Verrucomicrobiae bacterium]